MALKQSATKEIFEHSIKNTFKMEMDNGIFKRNNADEVKSKALKLECTNYGKNINGSPTLIQKFLIMNHIHTRFFSLRKPFFSQSLNFLNVMLEVRLRFSLMQI